MPFGVSAASGAVLAGRAGRKAQATQTAHTQHALVLFGTATAAGQVRPFTYYGLRVYRWKIWDGDTLVRDFVPCRRAYDCAAGLLDRKSGRFYGNAGTGSFSSGEEHSLLCASYTRLEYLQATGPVCREWAHRAGCRCSRDCVIPPT